MPARFQDRDLALRDRIAAERLLDAASLTGAVEAAAARGGDLASVLVATRLLAERTVVRLLCRITGYPGVELIRSILPVKNLDLLPEGDVRRKLVLPLVDLHGELVLAMADPDDASILDELRFVSGRKILRHVAVPAVLRATIDAAFALKATGEPMWRGKEAWSLQPGPDGRAAVVHPGEPLTEGAVEATEPEMPVVRGTAAAAHAGEELVVVGLMDPLFDAPSLPPTPSRRTPPPAPAAPAARAEADRTTLKVEGVGHGKIALVVDDDRDLRGLMVKLVQPFGCALVEADDGAKALELAREARPDLVVLDAMLPGMNGFEVCRAIKGDPELRQAAVIMVSGIYRGWKIAVDVKERYGANAFFEKPFKNEDLTRSIRTLLVVGAADTDAERARREAALATCKEAAARSRAGKLDEAIGLFRAAADKDPFSAEPHFYLGQALTVADKPYEALASLERAVELRPDLDPPLFLLGELYRRLGFAKTAAEVFTRAARVCKDPARRAKAEEQARALAPPAPTRPPAIKGPGG